MSVTSDRDAITVPTARKWARVIASLTERFSDLDISTSTPGICCWCNIAKVRLMTSYNSDTVAGADSRPRNLTVIDLVGAG